MPGEFSGDPEQFGRYIEEGDAAIRLHPDFEVLTAGGGWVSSAYMTCARDMISSILHAVFDAPEAPIPLEERLASSPEELVDLALETYRGDQEDR